VWILNKSPKRHLLRGFLFSSIHSPPFYPYITAVAPGTVGTVPTVLLFLAGTANRTTIGTENNNFEMKKRNSLLMSL
jgi:hypothetical protein